MSEMTDEDCLQEQVLQLREAITVIENQANGVPSIQPEEIWSIMSSEGDENKPLHPRIQQMLQGHVDIDQEKRGLKRMENDMNDLHLSDHEMYDPFEHELDGKSEDEHFPDPTPNASEDEEQTEDLPDQRDKEQRPLSAYMNHR